MNVLVFGAGGPVGERLVKLLQGNSQLAVLAATQDGDATRGRVRLDLRNQDALRAALRGIDAVVHCTDGSSAGLAQGTANLVRAAGAGGCMRIVQVGSQAAYGAVEGIVDEHATPGRGAGPWRQAEARLVGFGSKGGNAVMLRAGCVWGPRHGTWAGRLARWLQDARLGDMGADGDGWSNLVHVDDVCIAVLRALQLQLLPGESRVYNLAGADSPRWNEVLIDLALTIGATPVRRMHPLALRWHAHADPALALLRRVTAAARPPEPLCPALLALWRSQLRLDPRAAMRDLKIDWTPYPVALHEVASWWTRQQECSTPPAAVPQGLQGL